MNERAHEHIFSGIALKTYYKLLVKKVQDFVEPVKEVDALMSEDFFLLTGIF